MRFDWKNFLSLAEVLAANSDDASKRTAISRAYYCAFNLALARAKSKGRFPPKKTPTHQWCWEQYRGTNDKACVQLATTGDRMRKMRVYADYNAADIRRLDDAVQSILDDARQFLADLDTLDLKYP
jgi:uncharacterized protein (UPF0332 family)